MSHPPNCQHASVSPVIASAQRHGELRVSIPGRTQFPKSDIDDHEQPQEQIMPKCFLKRDARQDFEAAGAYYQIRRPAAFVFQPWQLLNDEFVNTS